MPKHAFHCMSLLLISFCAAAAQTSRAVSEVDLQGPAYWLARAAAEWSQIQDPNMKPWGTMAEAQALAGDREGLKRTVAEFVSIQAQDPQFVVRHYTSIASLFARVGDEEGLRRAIETVLAPGAGKTDTAVESRRANLIYYLFSVERHDQAIALAQALKDPSRRQDQLLEVAVAASRSGQQDSAKRAFALAESAARAMKATDGAWNRTARAYLELGDAAKAVQLAASREKDREYTLILGQAARVCAEAGRSEEAAKYAAEASTLSANGNWGDRMTIAPVVAHGVAMANHAPSISHLIKQANQARGVPVGAANPDGPGFPLPFAQSFAQACFQGLATGAASRGDAAAARRYLANSVAIGRTARRHPGVTTNPAWPALPVADALVRAGKPQEAVTLLTVGPYAAPESVLYKPGPNETDGGFRLRVKEIFEKAGDLERAAKISQAMGEGPRPVFNVMRVRLGQLQPLVTAIEELPTPMSRCHAFTAAALELARGQASSPVTRSAGP